MADIRLLVKSHPDLVYTREGYKVEVITTAAGWQHNLIYGYVSKNGKKIGHYWQPDGSFGNCRDCSPVSLTIMAENKSNK